MPLPEVTHGSVLQALNEIDREGVPKNRRSTRFCLVHHGKHYPPKYVLSLAVKHQTGQALRPQDHSGGVETKSRLSRLGFTVIACRKCHSAAPDRTAGRSSLPAIARLVIDSFSRYPPSLAEKRLLRVFQSWPDHCIADFLITPGGFASGKFPAVFPGNTGWNSDPRDFPAIRNEAETVASAILTPRLLKAARGKVRYLTLGIDLDAEDVSRPHAELVAVVDLRSGRIIRWTGKSYPIQAQENTLWHVTDLNSHCLQLAGRRVLVLGCHDLNLFSERTWKNQKPGSPRRNRTQAMRKLSKGHRPEVVLHHPHWTDSPRIWQTAWGGVRKLLKPPVWASAINCPAKPRAPLNAVLAQTRSAGGRFCDIILTPGRPPRFCPDTR